MARLKSIYVLRIALFALMLTLLFDCTKPVKTLLITKGAIRDKYAPVPGVIAGLIAEAQSGKAKAQVELGVKYAHAEGVPK